MMIDSHWDTKDIVWPVVDLKVKSRHGTLLLLLLQGLVKCIGGMVMAGIMRRIAEHHRYVTGGFPDLTVWNPDTRKFKAGIDMAAIISAVLHLF